MRQDAGRAVPEADRDVRPSNGSLPCTGGSSAPQAGFSARKLVSIRQQLGMSRAALARKLRVSAHTLWRWERGDRKPSGLYRNLVADLIDGATLRLKNRPRK